MEESGKETTIKSTTEGGSDSGSGGGGGGGCVGEQPVPRFGEWDELSPGVDTLDNFVHVFQKARVGRSSRDEHKLEKFKVISFDRPRGTALAFAAADGGGGGGSRAGFTGQKQANSDGGGIRGQVKEAEGGWLRRWLKRMSRASRRST